MAGRRRVGRPSVVGGRFARCRAALKGVIPAVTEDDVIASGGGGQGLPILKHAVVTLEEVVARAAVDGVVALATEDDSCWLTWPEAVGLFQLRTAATPPAAYS